MSIDNDKFWERVSKGSNNDCWLWIGGLHQNGYGGLKYKGKSEKAHRVSWMIHNGEIPDGLLVCHKCDVKNCVNPKHLFLGTQKDNIQDRIKKGRSNYALGERHGNSRLTKEKVLKIRNLYDSGKYSQAEICRIVKEDPRIVNGIILRRTWAWLDV